jgi:hypothetical protein
MSRAVSTTVILVAVLIVALLVTVNVTRCETISGPLGIFRITACEEEPLVNPPD